MLSECGLSCIQLLLLVLVTKTAKCRYLGNREWYYRSAGSKTTGKILNIETKIKKIIINYDIMRIKKIYKKNLQKKSKEKSNFFVFL